MVKKIIGQTYIWFILLLMYLPILVLIAFSFTESVNVGVWKGFSFGLYGDLFHSKETLVALANTLIIAITGAVLGFVIAHIAIGILGNYTASTYGLNASAFYFATGEGIAVLATMLLSLAAGIIPGVMAYKADATKYIR